jgi:GNAT superfamily N-acetyltransferase
MRDGDEAEAEAAWDDAYRALLVEQGLPTRERTPELIAHSRARMKYLRETDPLGSWVADDGDTIIGVAQAHTRGAVWVLATLGVVPGAQDHGVGRQLLDRALGYADAASPGAIFSSTDPRAMHRYIEAGFDLHPTAVALGRPHKVVVAPSGVRAGSADDLAQVNAVDRAVRGWERTGDIEFMLRMGRHLLIDEEGGGYAVIGLGQLMTLAALDEEVASRLLLAAISSCPDDAPVGVSWITARQQWALRVVSTAGVPLMIHESIMMRGGWEPELPYLASGIFG